jgi:hypothetical protein
MDDQEVEAQSGAQAGALPEEVMGRRWSCAGVLTAAFVVAQPAPASEARVSLSVRVLDPSGAAIPGASVTVESASGELRESVTDAKGAVRLDALPREPILIRASISGFETRERSLAPTPGKHEVELTLPLARLSEDVAVKPDERASASQGFGSVLTAAEIAALPDDPEELEELLKRMAGPGAVLRVNGFSGGRLPPKSQIRQIRFQMNPYSAEYHEAGHPRVDIVTKPGLGSWRTGVRSSARSSRLNARPPLAPGRAADAYQRYGVTLDGPLQSERTSFSMTFDGRLSDGARTLFGALPSGPFSALQPQTSDKLDVQARVEHAVSPAHTLRAEYQRLAHEQDGLGASGWDLPERAYAQSDVEHLLRFSDSGALGKKTATETLLELRIASTSFDPRSRLPAVQVLGAFASGGAQLEGSRRSAGLTLTQNFDWGVKNHAFRAGFRLETERHRDAERRNASGTFTFSSLEAYSAGRPALYTRRAGDAHVAFRHSQLGVYLQDEIKLGRRAVLSLGVREELQSHVDGSLNLAPRLGFTYSLGKSTTLRVAAGVFHDWYRAALHAETLRLDGERFREFLISDPAYPDPFATSLAAAAPPNRLLRSSGLELPRVRRASVGLERTFGGWRFHTDYSFERGDRQLGSENRNAPDAGLRPDAALGNVLEIVSAGRSRRHTINVNGGFMNPGARFGLFAGYLFTQRGNDGDSALSVPATPLGRAAEWGPAADDLRHRVFGFGRARFPRGFSLSGMLRFESGAPYNVTTGFDTNGDGIFNERAAGTFRNSARGDARFNLDARLAWARGFGPRRRPSGPQARIVRLGDGEMPSEAPAGEADRRFQVSLYLQAYNATNHTNARVYSGVITSPYFGSAVQADPGRRLELGASFGF